jgi:hypothetical protein
MVHWLPSTPILKTFRKNQGKQNIFMDHKKKKKNRINQDNNANLSVSLSLFDDACVIRTSQRADILPCIKSIVEVCKSISNQVDESQSNSNSEGRRPSNSNKTTTSQGEDDTESNNSDTTNDNKMTHHSNLDKNEHRSRLKNIRRQYSLALHHLLSASKGYVHGSGAYPLSLLDASIGHLASIVVELVELLGVSD